MKKTHDNYWAAKVNKGQPRAKLFLLSVSPVIPLSVLMCYLFEPKLNQAQLDNMA